MPSFQTAPNQRRIIICKKEQDKIGKKNKTTIKTSIYVDTLDEAMRTLSNSAFMLWIYLAKNNDGYDFYLSRTCACRDCNFSPSTYRRAVKTLEDKGYLKPTGKNQTEYIFYARPTKETDKKTEDDKIIHYSPEEQ